LKFRVKIENKILARVSCWLERQGPTDKKSTTTEKKKKKKKKSFFWKSETCTKFGRPTKAGKILSFLFLFICAHSLLHTDRQTDRQKDKLNRKENRNRSLNFFLVWLEIKETTLFMIFGFFLTAYSNILLLLMVLLMKLILFSKCDT